MNKKFLVVIGIVVLLLIGVGILKPSFTRQIDWEESFNERSTKPYGLKVFYKELFNIYSDKKIRTVYHSPYEYLIEHNEYGSGDHIAEGIYMAIGNTSDMGYYSQEELLFFAAEGNTVFISDYDLPQMLKDSLGVDIADQYSSDSLSVLSFENTDSKITLDKAKRDFHFDTYTSETTEILGYVIVDNTPVPNFIKIPYDNGQFIIHLQPKVFTNYHVLKDERYKYVENILSSLPDEPIYFDSYVTYTTPYNGKTEQNSNLSWFLEQLPFKWAWYLAVFLLFLFMIFNAKRRQRIINTIKPPENTSVAFVKTISNLYFETKDHKNLIDKKITYFLERVRSDFNLETDILDEEFKERLLLKSGKKKEVINTLIKYINWLQTKTALFEINLIKLNKLIEDFYKK